MQRPSVKHVVISGLMTALSVVLLQFASFRFSIVIGGSYQLSIGFGVVPVIFSGVVLGPFYGAAVGALADFMKGTLFPYGAYFPGFTFSYAMMGFTPGILMILFKKSRIFTSKSPYPYLPLLISITISQILFSVILNTIWNTVISGTAFLALLPARVLAQVILIPIHTYIIYFIANHKDILRHLWR